MSPLRGYLHDSHPTPPGTERELQTAFAALRRATSVTPQKAQLLAVYHSLLAPGELQASPDLQALLVKKSSKSQSGVLVRRSAGRVTSFQPAAF